MTVSWAMSDEGGNREIQLEDLIASVIQSYERDQDLKPYQCVQNEEDSKKLYALAIEIPSKDRLALENLKGRICYNAGIDTDAMVKKTASHLTVAMIRATQKEASVAANVFRHVIQDKTLHPAIQSKLDNLELFYHANGAPNAVVLKPSKDSEQ